MAARLVAHRHHRAGADARLVRSQHGTEERAEAKPRDADALGIDLGPADSQSTIGLPAAAHLSVEK